MDIEWLGPYKITKKLGRGGMGTVYQGIHRETSESVAVKLLSPALAEEEGFRVRFEAEIETLRKLNHPNIVRLIGFGQQDGQLFYSMEIVEGNSLEEELRHGRHFEWREVARMGIEICLALRHAHDRGIIHRDIKPANLLLTPNGIIKLSDFGIARLFGYSRLTIVGNVVGTAEYMAPEQAEGQPVDARSDLYSLGALLYTLLARRPLFHGKSLPDLLHKQRFERPDPVRKHARDVPEELEHILEQLLEKNPARRIPNANLLGRRLEALLHAFQVGQETIEAGVSWFDDEDSPPSAELATLIPLSASEDVSVAPTIDQPLTVPLPESEKIPQGSEPKVSTPASPSATTTSPEAFSPRSHFIPVDENELDQLEEDQTRPAMVSWQTWALAGALLLLGLTVWWFLQPPKANTLYYRVAAHMETDSADALPRTRSEIEEVQNIISNYFLYYPDDSRGPRVKKWEKELDLRRQQWDFDQRISGRSSTNGLSAIEQMYLEAISHERLNPTQAVIELQALVDLYNHSEIKKGTAERCLELANRRLARLEKEVEKLATKQLDVLHDRLDAADSLRVDQPKRAAAIYRAVIELYTDKPWAAEPVRRARKML